MNDLINIQHVSICAEHHQEKGVVVSVLNVPTALTLRNYTFYS